MQITDLDLSLEIWWFLITLKDTSYPHSEMFDRNALYIEGMRVTSSSYQEVMQEHLLSGKKLLSGLDSPYIQTEKSYLIALNNVKQR